MSTALMYSFAERADTEVVDEPLYGHYLTVSDTQHPGRDEVLANVDCDGNGVMRRLLDRAENGDGVLFLKQMAHHLVDVDHDFLECTQNVFLIRDPREMLPSLTIQMPHAGLADTGLQIQWYLYEELRSKGQDPLIVDSRQLLLDPGLILRKLCAGLGIEFSDDMLTWSAGPRKEDGIWAKYWYHAVHKSSAFAPYVATEGFPAHLNDLLHECRPWYDKLFARALVAND